MSFTSKYKMKEPKIVLRRVINFSHSIKYLGLQIDRNGYFKEYLSMVAKKGEKILISLGSLMSTGFVTSNYW